MSYRFQPGNSSEKLLQLSRANLEKGSAGIPSLCSANRFVLEAGMEHASREGSLLLVEATSNQVNQYGGYTGQTPAQFAASLGELAAQRQFPAEQMILGGDHLGPHVWKAEPASSAMAKACELVRSYVMAGFTKIHLDASMPCTDDPGDRLKPLADEIVSARQAELCQAAELAFQRLPPGAPPPLYVIGTEVPIPGGELAESKAPEVTRVEDVARTVECSREAFLRLGLEEAWDRVLAVVVQPGVEFGDSVVFAYDRGKVRALGEFAETVWQRVFEAHSTDYQTPTALRQMVQDHFAILKVGPALTFAFREAVFALAIMEEEYLDSHRAAKPSKVRTVLEDAMLQNPGYWNKYYRGNDAALTFSRKYSYSDRSRYYWPVPAVEKALEQLILNLSHTPLPLSLVSQYLPRQYWAVREGRLTNHPVDLIRDKILEVISIYGGACGLDFLATTF
jgi:D-tagatose-1,6-bisphosphate aldolase subunit GatZ/KbaZ